MVMSYKSLLHSGAGSVELAQYVTSGDMVPLTIRIPVNLKEAAKDFAQMRGMSLSALVRHCLINELIDEVNTKK